MSKFDVIVVGAGIIGTCTAYHCQRLGMKTLLIDQFRFGHLNGSSHGKSRIIRYAHTDAEYIPLVDDAYGQIAELEKKRGEKLWKKTGLLFLGDNHGTNKISEILKKCKLQHELLGNEEDEFVQLGGTALDQQKFVSNSTADDGVHVNTSTVSYITKKLVFAVGTWLQDLIPQVNKAAKVQPLAMAVTYWRPREEEDMHSFTREEFPVFIVHNANSGEAAFGMPAVDYPDAIKFCNDKGDPFTVGDETPNPSQHIIDLPARHIREHIKLLDHTNPAYLDKCKYTMSSDRHYVIDWHPKDKNVLIAGCMSGSGYKVAPGIGNTLAHMAAEKKLPYDVSFFSLKIFDANI